METDFSHDLVDDPALNNIASINTRQTLLIVNDFITHTVDFMNKFSSLSEQKLYAVSQKTAKLEILISLLEAKLESIPLHETGYISSAPASTVQSQPAPSQPAVQEAVPPPLGPPPAQTIPTPQPPPPSAPSSAPALLPPPPVEAAPPAADPNATLIKDDPRYKKYFDMMARGVPKFAVMQKFAIENDGADASFLDMDPNTPISPTALVNVVEQADDSD